MAQDKLWQGNTDGDLSKHLNWAPVSIRNATYKWTQSPATATEYYLELVGGGDPGILEPPLLYEAGPAITPMVAGTVGSLAAGEWDFGDNDTLGYSTIYVRLTAGTDPDSQDTDWVQLRDVYRTGDSVRVLPGSGLIDTAVDVSGTTLVDWIFEKGYTGAVASATDFLRLKLTGQFVFDGSGDAYIDLSDSAISPIIRGTSRGSTGQPGLELIGSAIATLAIEGGNTGLASRHGLSATVATIRQAAGTLIVGSDAVPTTINHEGGSLTLRATATTLNNYAGTVIAEEAAALTTLNQKGGSYVHDSTGTVATANLDGGSIDHRRGTISSLVVARAKCRYKRRTGTTLTAETLPSAPFDLSVTAL
jgi:hypothetical protein